jgi:preprotein translocase subunit Sec61beta
VSRFDLLRSLDKGGTGRPVRMAVKKDKKSKGPNIQQAAGLIRYFDEESEDAWQISKGMIYTVCIVFSIVVYLGNQPTPDDNLWMWMWERLTG